MKIFVILALVITHLLVGCSSNISPQESTTLTSPTIYWGNVIPNDISPLEESLTISYPLSDLRAYFSPHNIVSLNAEGWLSYSEINLHFPIEITRSQGYSVYRVAEGGFYYVFWINTLDPDTFAQNEDPQMYYSTYIPSSEVKKDFSQIKERSSTLQDVVLLDPDYELQYHRSSGIYSFSYLSPEKILQVSYQTVSSGFPKNEELIVSAKTIVDRNSAVCFLSSIMDSDLP